MKAYHRHIILLLAILLHLMSFGSVLYGQELDCEYVLKEFEKSNVEQARGDIDYSDDFKIDKEKSQDRSNENAATSLALATAFKFILILLLIGLVVAILYFMLGGESLFKPKSKEIKSIVTDSDFVQIEKNLRDAEIDGVLEMAIKNQEYKLALRLYYLAVLQSLSNKEFISWKKNKTNRQYISETTNFNFNEKFVELTYLFELFWYGELEVREPDFLKIQRSFKDLIGQIKSVES